jgi:Xaa-Pro aminopeptidase
MDSAHLDLLYLSAPESICYATGYASEWYQTQSTSQWPPTSGVAIHVDHDTPIHFESEQEKLLVQSTAASTDIRIPTSGSPKADNAWSWWTTGLIADELKAAGWLPGTVGLEMGSCRPNRTVSEQFQESLEAAGANVVDATQVVRAVRKIKSPQELAYVRTRSEEHTSELQSL